MYFALEGRAVGCNGWIGIFVRHSGSGWGCSSNNVEYPIWDFDLEEVAGAHGGRTANRAAVVLHMDRWVQLRHPPLSTSWKIWGEKYV